MAQSQKPTYQGYAEIAKLLAGEAASALTKIVGLEGTCTAAAEASTFADPANDATHIADSGLSIVAAHTVATVTTDQTDDTVQVDHVFTASGTKTVTGFHVCNDDGDVTFMECCFNAGIAMESSDTLTIQAKLQFKLGS
jgi:hypothetical protein